jgi:hypothetical protein
LTQPKKMTLPVFVGSSESRTSVNLIADERYNPLKSRTKEGSIR